MDTHNALTHFSIINLHFIGKNVEALQIDLLKCVSTDINISKLILHTYHAKLHLYLLAVNYSWMYYRMI